MEDILGREPGNAEGDPRTADMELIDIVEELQEQIRERDYMRDTAYQNGEMW